MKIAFVDQDLSLKTGSRRFTCEVASQLLRMGHEVKIFTTKMDWSKCFRQYLSLPVEVVPWRNYSGGKRRKAASGESKKGLVHDIMDNLSYCVIQTYLAMEISEKVADAGMQFALLHYHGEHWLLPFFYHMTETKGAVYLNMVPPIHGPRSLAFLEKSLGRRIVDAMFDLPPVGLWKKSSYEKIGLFITPSKFLLDETQKQKLLHHKRAKIVPHGVNHSEFFPTNEEEPFALYLGRIHPHKSLELAVLAMEKTQPDKSLIIAGDIDEGKMWYKEKLIHLAEKLKVSERLKIISSPTEYEIVRLMQRCAVFLFPSTIDTFGLVVLEAMACGKPIVACNRGGVPEIVGSAGYLLEPVAGEWRKTVGRLLSDSALRQRMGKAALEKSRAFSWENTTNKLLRAFNNCASSRHSAL